jgi:hypothetical protein
MQKSFEELNTLLDSKKIYKIYYELSQDLEKYVLAKNKEEAYQKGRENLTYLINTFLAECDFSTNVQEILYEHELGAAFENMECDDESFISYRDYMFYIKERMRLDRVAKELDKKQLKLNILE